MDGMIGAPTEMNVVKMVFQSPMISPFNPISKW